MRTVGVICECNPMHAGHRYLLDCARASGADAVICVMSGCFTQRGEPAVLDPRTRARILLLGGADAVLELPFPYSASGAEFFAAAGVSILDRLGVDELWFGSECGDLSRLWRVARLCESEAFSALYRDACRDGSQGTAKAFFDCLSALGEEGDGLLANDILAISYLRALLQRGSAMQARTVKRLGCGFNDTELREDAFPSASALRARFAGEGLSAWEGYLSEEALALCAEQIAKGSAPALWTNAERAVLSHFRMISPDRVAIVPELSGGLGHRISRASQEAVSLSDLIERSMTKKYTQSRICRGILFSMTDVLPEDLRREPAYAVLLAANAKGCEFLGACRRSASIPVVTSHAQIPDNADANRQELLTRQAFALYTLCLPHPMPTDLFLRCSSYIEASKKGKTDAEF